MTNGYLAVFIVIALAFFGLSLYSAGYNDGTSDGKISQLKASVEAERTRSNINEHTSSLSDYDLCISVGGLRDDCAELQRVE